MPLHFLSEDAAGARPGDEVVLAGAEAHHAASVRRVRPGEAVSLGDGRGTWVEGACLAASPREVIVRVESHRLVDAPRPRVVLVQALAKGDRDELAIQAATELGVDAVVPWQAARSVSRWDGKEAKGIARWEAIVREASKQAHRAWVPEIEPLASSKDLQHRAAGARMLVLEPTAPQRMSELAFDPADGRDLLLVVGPEGGIDAAELAGLADAGARPVRLGDTVLRTSTAGAAAMSVVNVRLGRF